MIPKGHPRYESLKQREALVAGYEKGVTVLEGLIAHGRGEAFDYLLDEKTIPPAKKAILASAALLCTAENPVVSVNGNTAVLCSSALVELARESGAKLEVNLFYRSNKRVKLIEEILLEHGAKKVYGAAASAEIEGLSSERRKVDKNGIYASDVVLVPLEDGDRTEALVRVGKKVIAIDLNPLSRTSRHATITIVDNIVRAIPALTQEVRKLKDKNLKELQEIVMFDNHENLKASLEIVNTKLKQLKL
ncbi:MAG: 4-phosphopantoate--beta-alanine ligase [Candidatus Hydrothermarchaeales archaeon]